MILHGYQQAFCGKLWITFIFSIKSIQIFKFQLLNVLFQKKSVRVLQIFNVYLKLYWSKMWITFDSC